MNRLDNFPRYNYAGGASPSVVHGAVSVMDLMPESAYIPKDYYLSLIVDPQYPIDLVQVERIRKEFDPGFVPITRYLIYQTRAGGIKRCIHHGVARYDKLAEPDPMVVAAKRPTHGWLATERVNVIDRWFENVDHVRPGTARALNNLPPPFVPWGEWVYAWARDTYWAATKHEKLRYLKEKGEESRQAKERETQQEEATYRLKQDAGYMSRLVDKLGPDDAKEYFARRSGAHRPEPKPFADLGGGA